MGTTGPVLPSGTRRGSIRRPSGSFTYSRPLGSGAPSVGTTPVLSPRCTERRARRPGERPDVDRSTGLTAAKIVSPRTTSGSPPVVPAGGQLRSPGSECRTRADASEAPRHLMRRLARHGASPDRCFTSWHCDDTLRQWTRISILAWPLRAPSLAAALELAAANLGVDVIDGARRMGPVLVTLPACGGWWERCRTRLRPRRARSLPGTFRGLSGPPGGLFGDFLPPNAASP